ncbi:hypothetical protein N7471_006714 [Penicillium samsonianum]|uniref:uncharacterized protein n=1 Tax=Penicillium samsonianum TaxID=1882272 RepID=UPI0025483544|nr:uncharacterized protein N7471_006714 [Penicillium samsonianum]KAJ6140228.1 hypothetical protein N7471_006714 [Penicillium samsonianum]
MSNPPTLPFRFQPKKPGARLRSLRAFRNKDPAVITALEVKWDDDSEPQFAGDRNDKIASETFVLAHGERITKITTKFDGSMSTGTPLVDIYLATNNGQRWWAFGGRQGEEGAEHPVGNGYLSFLVGEIIEAAVIYPGWISYISYSMLWQME